MKPEDLMYLLILLQEFQHKEGLGEKLFDSTQIIIDSLMVHPRIAKIGNGGENAKTSQ